MKGTLWTPGGSPELSSAGELPEPMVAEDPRVTPPQSCSNGGERQLGIQPPTGSLH